MNTNEQTVRDNEIIDEYLRQRLGGVEADNVGKQDWAALRDFLAFARARLAATSEAKPNESVMSHAEAVAAIARNTIDRLKAKLRAASEAGAVPIYQCMANDDDDNPTSAKLWMDMDKAEYDDISVRHDIRSRIVYAAPPAPVEAGAVQWFECSEATPMSDVRVLVAGIMDGPHDWRVKTGYYSAETRTWHVDLASWKPIKWAHLPRPDVAPSDAPAQQAKWGDFTKLAIKHGCYVPGYGPFAVELLATYGKAPNEQPHWVYGWLNAMRAVERDKPAPAAQGDEWEAGTRGDFDDFAMDCGGRLACDGTFTFRAAAWHKFRDALSREPIAWEATTPVYFKYITDSQYRKFSAKVRAWYRPYRCTVCTQRAAEADAQSDERATEFKRLLTTYGWRCEHYGEHAAGTVRDVVIAAYRAALSRQPSAVGAESFDAWWKSKGWGDGRKLHHYMVKEAFEAGRRSAGDAEDAEQWRFIRDHADPDNGPFVMDAAGNDLGMGPDLDAAIKAARAQRAAEGANDGR